MADGFSHQDLQDLDEIARQLPKGDPRADRIRATIRAQQSQSPAPNPGGVKNFGSDLWNMAKAAPGAIADMLPGSPTPFLPTSIREKVGMGPAANSPEALNANLQHYGEQKKAGYSLPYRLASPVAESLGVNVGGMEDSARKGDVSGVIGHAAVVPAVMAASAGLAKFGEPIDTAIAGKMRYPATEAQADIGAPGSVKPLPFTPSWMSEGLTPKGRFGSPTNPGRFSKIPNKVSTSVLQDEAHGPVGSPTNPGPMSKLPTRVPKSVLDEERAAQTPRGAPVERDATLNKRNIPEFAGEGESPIPSTNLTPLGQRPRSRMGPPLRPNVFASPEEAQIYDNHMSRLGAEAKDAGMYSAARGKVGRVPDYQERTGAAMSPFGGGSPPPGELSPPSTIRPYAPDPGTRTPDFDLVQQAASRMKTERAAGTIPEGVSDSARAQQILDELKKAQ